MSIVSYEQFMQARAKRCAQQRRRTPWRDHWSRNESALGALVIGFCALLFACVSFALGWWMRG